MLKKQFWILFLTVRVTCPGHLLLLQATRKLKPREELFSHIGNRQPRAVAHEKRKWTRWAPGFSRLLPGGIFWIMTQEGALRQRISVLLKWDHGRQSLGGLKWLEFVGCNMKQEDTPFCFHVVSLKFLQSIFYQREFSKTPQFNTLQWLCTAWRKSKTSLGPFIASLTHFLLACECFWKRQELSPQAL